MLGTLRLFFNYVCVTMSVYRTLRVPLYLHTLSTLVFFDKSVHFWLVRLNLNFSGVNSLQLFAEDFSPELDKVLSFA